MFILIIMMHTHMYLCTVVEWYKINLFINISDKYKVNNNFPWIILKYTDWLNNLSWMLMPISYTFSMQLKVSLMYNAWKVITFNNL